MALSTQRASASLHPAVGQSTPQWCYDVFLSFRGEDTRKSFVSHLYYELQHMRNIETFKDDRELEIGTSISPELLSAIERSRLAIVVLSPNYASSTWCLDELLKILQCMEGKCRILPVFYEAVPSDVRYQRGSFAEAFAKHEEKFGEDKERVKGWRAALTKVASLAGLSSLDYKSDRELIEKIVGFVWSKVHPTFPLLDSTELVGLDLMIEQVGLLLAPEANDVCFIGIWGMGGVGKTTFAKLVFDRYSRDFEVFKFLDNIREVRAKHGTLVNLQQQLLFPFLKEPVWNELLGAASIKNCFHNKKILLILDNVDHINQLEVLAGKKDWFGKGSRIVITTRDARLLVQHGIHKPHEVKGLNNDDALKLFSRNAFKKDHPEEGFLKLSKCFVNYTRGLPLALKVLGRTLYMRDEDEWKSELQQLEKFPELEIFNVLKISYDGVNEANQRIFLDIAFFHMGKVKEEVIEILENCGSGNARSGINVLIEKSLLTTRWGLVGMHDLIQEMAFEIVRQEAPDEPGGRSRLCRRDDIFHVLTNNTGTEAIRGMVLHMNEFAKAEWSCEAFSKMLKLKIVEFHNVIVSSGPKFLPNSLVVFKWNCYPSKCLPPGFQPRLLTQLKMPDSKLVRLWDGRKELPNLKHMFLRGSKNLTHTPDFTGSPKLKSLYLERCENLVEIHPSIAVHKRLEVLYLQGCKSLKSLPDDVEMDSLKTLDLSGCSKLKKIPEFGGLMKNLAWLSLRSTAIEKLPSSIERLVGLVRLNLRNCKNLLGLPSAICNLKSLEVLIARGCSNIDKLPENFGEMERLVELSLGGTAIRKLPHSFGRLKNFRELSLSRYRHKSGHGRVLTLRVWCRVHSRWFILFDSVYPL